MRVMLMVLGLVMMVSCGVTQKEQAATEDNKGGASDVEFFQAMRVTSEASLPVCNTAAKDRLVYVTSTSNFRVCDGTLWSAIDLKGAAGASGTPGLSMVGRWKFHVDTLENDICAECSVALVFIGDVQVVKFSDGSGFVSASGAMVDQTSNDTDYYGDNFSYAFFLPASDAQQEYVAKFHALDGFRIRFRVTLGATPVFKATIDTDGTFSNNTDTALTLTAM